MAREKKLVEQFNDVIWMKTVVYTTIITHQITSYNTRPRQQMFTTYVDTVVGEPAACAFADWRRIFKYGPRRHQRVDVDFTAVTGQHVRDDARRRPARLF